MSNRFIDLMKICKEVHIKTDGYFNPLVDISTIGYSHSFEENNFTVSHRKSDLNFDSVIIAGNTVHM
jgi:thiamine biosynthesis lipoprotein ApbE